MVPSHRDAGRLDLSPTAPFDLAQSLAFIRGFAPCAADHGTAAGHLSTGGYADGTPFVATLREDGGTSLVGTVHWPAEVGDTDAVASHLRASLSLDDDLGWMYRQARQEDPAFERVVDDLYGYHHVRFPTPFEAACWAALSQRTPWQVARSLKSALVDAAGDRVSFEGHRQGDAGARTAGADGLDAEDGTIPLFPTPERVLANEDAVVDAISHDRKRKTILDAARAFRGGDLDALSSDALRDRLADIWGFGPWSSEFVALRGFGRMDRLPDREERLRAVVASVYGLDESRASDDALARLSAPYDSQAGYWAHYLRVFAHRLEDSSA